MTDLRRPLWKFTSDTHLFHGKVAAARGFGTEENPDIEAHAEWLCDLWRSMVRPQDRVLIAGDLTGGGAEATERALELLESLPGEKHFVSGNHDETHPSNRRATRRQRRWLQVFDSVNPYLQLVLGEGDHRRWVAVSHFPYSGDAEHAHEDRYDDWRLKPSARWLLHGHTHRAHQKVHDGNQIHIGLDAWLGFVSETTILDLIENASPQTIEA